MYKKPTAVAQAAAEPLPWGYQTKDSTHMVSKDYIQFHMWPYGHIFGNMVTYGISNFRQATYTGK